MRQRLLTVMGLLCLTLAAMAQSWVAPVAPVEPTVTGSDVEAGSAYYIRNVGAAQYLTAANLWATRISLSEDGVPYVQIMVEALDEAEQETYPDCYKMRLNGTFYFNGPQPNGTMRSDYAVTDKYLFREYAAGGPATGQVDRRNQACWYFKITKNDHGYYHIQSAPGLNNFNVDGDEYAGGEVPGDPVLFDYPADSKFIDWEFIPVESVNLDDFEVYGAAFRVYSARLRLYDMLLDATRYGADTSAAGAVYNNDASTVEDINAAIDELRPLVRAAILAYGVKNSKADNPIDLTKYLLTNPDFSTGNTNGWVLTEGIGQNQGFQANNVYENTRDGIRIEQFIEAWRPAPAILGDGFIYQTITGLPSGHYVLECDGIARNTSSESSDDYVSPEEYKGAYLYYTDGNVVNHSPETLCDIEMDDEDGNLVRVPAHFKFEFDIQDVESINVGLMFDDTNLTWVAADNFKFFMAGPSQALPSYVGLTAEVGTVEKLLKTDFEAQQAAADALKSALAEAKVLADAASDESKDAQYTAAYNKLHEARLNLLASIEAYKKAQAFIEQMNVDLEHYAADVYAPLAKQLGQKLDDFAAAYEERSLSAEQIAADIEGYNDFLKAGIKQIFDQLAAAGAEAKEPLEISILFDDMSYAYGEAQTAFAGGYPANNPVWMNETGTGNFKTNYSTAEVWDVRPFHIYRDLANLPKGKYSIQTRAFVRIGNNADNYTNWKNDTFDATAEYAYVYAGNNHAKLCNVAELALTENYPTGSAAIETEDGTTIYVPNQQQSAYEIFTFDKFAELGAKTDVEVAGVVATDGGTLRIGVVGTESLPAEHWVIWHGFKLFYHGMSGDALDEEIVQLMEQAQDANTGGVVAAEKKLADACELGNKALAASDIETKNQALSALTDALDYAGKSLPLVQEIVSQAQDYSIKIAELEGDFTDTALLTLLGQIDNAVKDEAFESNEKVEEWIVELKKDYARYILSNTLLDGATPDEPYDITLLVENADFSNGTTANRTAPKGWELYLSSQTGNVQSNNGGYEAWHTGVATLSQEVFLLRNGAYRLTADALYRFNDETSCTSALANGDAPIVDAFLFADNDSVPVYFWLDETQTCPSPEEATELGLNGNTYTLNGRVLTNHVIVAPNSGAQVQSFFDGGRYNDVTVNFSVSTDGEKPVKIGFQKNATYPNSWIYFDNVHLYYLGGDEVAIDDLADDSRHGSQPTSIYTLDGRVVNRLARGINIVRQADGRVVKVLR